MITIKKLNETYLRVICDDAGVAYELKEYFTFKVPGYQYTPKFKARLWDGNIALYNLHTKTIYVGLLPLIEKFTKERNYEIKYEIDTNDVEFSLHEATEFFKSLNTGFEERDYQISLFCKAVRKSRALLISPTGSGKSFIIYLLTKYYNKKTLIIVPNTNLVEQMYSDFINYGYNKDDMHKIYYGQEKDVDKQVIIGTWQSLSKMPQEWLDEYEVVFGDEVHLFSAKVLTGLMEKLVHCKYRFGLTGTLDKSETNKLVLIGLFGDIIQEVKTKELIEKKVLAPLKIKCIILKYPEDVRKSTVNAKYEDEIKYIIGHKNRSNFIKNLVYSLKGNTLILFTRIESHGDILNDMIKKDLPNKHKLFYIHGGVDGKDRDAIRPIVEKEDDVIILASYGTLSTGINIKKIDNIVFASPYKSIVKVLQSIGRGLRILPDKKLTVIDIVDDISWGKSKNHTLRHFADRIDIYNKEEFEYQLYFIGVK